MGLESAGAALGVEPAAASDQITLTDLGADEVRQELQKLDLDSMTPREALAALYELKKKVQ